MMDSAICGEKMRCGYSRCGMYTNHWDLLRQKFENLPSKSAAGVDPAVAGSFRAGMWRAGVYIPLFDEVKKRFEKGV